MSMELLVCWITGIIVGMLLLAAIVGVKSAVGTFHIDFSDPEKDVFHLDVHDLNSITNKKYIIIRVEKHEKLSQK